MMHLIVFFKKFPSRCMLVYVHIYGVDCTADERLFDRHHSPLSDALALLAHAIHLVLRRRPTSEGDPTPTSAHIVLRRCVDGLIDDVEKNPFVGVRERQRNGKKERIE